MCVRKALELTPLQNALRRKLRFGDFQDGVVGHLEDGHWGNPWTCRVAHRVGGLKDNRAVLIMAHRPAAIQECDLLLVLEDGTRRAFGPRDQVLRDMVKNHAEIAKNTDQKPTALGGVA